MTFKLTGYSTIPQVTLSPISLPLQLCPYVEGCLQKEKHYG